MNLQSIVGLKDVNRIKNVRFSKIIGSEDVASSPKQIFDEYKSLDELIFYNRTDTLLGLKGDEFHAEKLKRLKIDPEESLHRAQESMTAPQYTAHVTYTSDDGAKETTECLGIKFRTNFDPTLLKRPSIVILEKDEFPVLVLREARTYAPEDLAMPFDMIKKPKSRQFYAKRLFPAAPNLVPEPRIVKALEALYAQGYPRITLPFYEVDDDDETMHYVRPFVGTSLRDVSFNLEIVATYLGIVHSYGLSERLDRNEGQYVVSPLFPQKTRLVNIDPDFFVWSLNRSFLLADSNDFLEVIEEEIYKNLTPGKKHEIKKMSEKIREKNKENKHALYEALREFYPQA